MPRFCSILSANWLSIVSYPLISIASSIIFFFLDFMDTVMCVFFGFFDKYMEGKASKCYCTEKEEVKQDSQVENDGESELSESLNGRENIFREKGLRKTVRILRESGEGFSCVDEMNRWSDCGCDCCVDWMRNGNDGKLHVVVNRQQDKDKKDFHSEEMDVQNVIFIHGFLSSSWFWTETIFPILSQNPNKKYNLFAVDLLGFGRSPKPRNCSYTLKDHIEMIEKSVIKSFELKSFHLVAHSMGCVIVLALAAKYSESVKSITLVAPPYYSCSKGNASSEALKRVAIRRVWPPLLFFTAFMSWYEHLGRCMCFFICRNHRTWEWILKLITRRRELHFSFMDVTRHTHRSAWHTMHNVICGGARFLDNYLEALKASGVKIHVIQGSRDQIVPLECSYNMKMKAPYIELDIVQNADHSNVIFGREKDFTRDLERLWAATGETIQN